MKTKKRKLPLIILLVIAAAAGWWFWQRGGESKPVQIEYREIAVGRNSIHEVVQATGEVRPQNRLEIKPPVAGRIEQMLVDEGDEVKQGQVVAWMSSSERASLLDAARATSKEELAYWQDVYKPTPLLAPIDGTVIVRAFEPGQTVASSDAILVIANNLIVAAQLDETDIGQIRVGQTATVNLDAYAEVLFTGRVDKIAYDSKLVNNVTIYEVEVLPLNLPSFVRSGMTANLSFAVNEKNNVLTLPIDAIQKTNGVSAVLVPDPENAGNRELRQIQTGVTDGKFVEIRSGLHEGDLVLEARLRMPSEKAAQKRNPLMPSPPHGPRSQQHH